jgi:hypothetical protein
VGGNFVLPPDSDSAPVFLVRTASGDVEVILLFALAVVALPLAVVLLD